MALNTFGKSCLCLSVFCISVSLPICGFAGSEKANTTGPVTVTSTVHQEEGYSSDGMHNVTRLTDPVTTTSSTSMPGKPKPTEPVATTTNNNPAAVSSKSHMIEKQASININDHVVMVSGSLSVGFVNGRSRELVYNPDTGHKNSELDWRLDQVAMMGVGASIKPLSWLRFNGNFWFKLNDGNGSMDDYDWRLTGWDDWTDWSHSSSPVTEGAMYDINMELTFLHFNEASVYGILGYKHDHWKWKAQGGTFVYSTYFVRDTIGSFPDETLGTYEQTFDVPYIGLGFHANLDPVSLTGRFIFSSMVKAKDEDHHLLRDLIVKSSLDDGRMYGLDFACTYNFTPHIAATAAFQYTKYDELKGNKDWNFFSEGDQFSYGGGLDNESTLFSLSLLFTL